MTTDLQSIPDEYAEDAAPTELIDWKNQEKSVLVLNYTMACPLQCDFCCYGCHPKRQEKMPLSLALNLAAQVGELEQFSSVGFTGGEALLFFDELKLIGQELAKTRTPFTIATAAHWATTLDESLRILSALQDVGLKRLNISHDPSHAKFVPAANVINAAKAASRLSLDTCIVGTFYTITESLEELLPEVVGMPYIHLFNKVVAKVGRAARKPITQESYGISLQLDGLTCYRRIYHDIVVFYDGVVYPCCSTFNRATAGIALGNAFTDRLKDLWELAEGSLMLRVMKRQGFGEIYRIVEAYDRQLYSELPKLESVVGPCGLCNKIFGNQDIAKRVRIVFEQYEKEKVDKALSWVASRIGDSKTEEMLELVVSSSQINRRTE